MLSRRDFSMLLGGTLATPLLAKDGKFRVYIGTYTQRESKGIYSFVLDTNAGTLTPEGLAVGVQNPSFLAIHPSGKYVYAVGELNTFRGERSGALTAFRILPTGKLERLNDVSTGGGGTCHVNVSRNGHFVAAVNYGGGSWCTYGLESDGTLGSRTAFFQFEGTGGNPQRQDRPHAHSVNFDKANHFAVVADLGTDRLNIYKFDSKTGSMTPNDPPAAKVAPGSGPRHFAFHPNGKFAYVINEILCTVTAFQWDGKKGTLTEIETVPSLPVPVQSGYSTAEIVVHPSGKFLYGSNRGHDSIAVFQIDAVTGKLKSVEHEPTQGKMPRNFAIDPTGKFLIAANQNSDSLVLFKIDPMSGALEAAGPPIPTPMPVCVRYLAI